MNDQDRHDDLRARLAGVDPARRAATPPIPPNLLEQIMTTNTVPTAGPSREHDTARTTSTPARRRWRMPAAFGGLAAAVAVAVGVATLGGGSPASAEPIRLTGSDDAMAMCLPFSTDILGEMPTAFAGTVTAVDGATVTLDIDRWYRDGTGSDAEAAVVNAPEGMEALIGGIAFEVGGDYLVSADAEGNVSYCGYTGPATDELRTAYDAAFPG